MWPNMALDAYLTVGMLIRLYEKNMMPLSYDLEILHKC